jgi:antitoxin (DNA-binding transcriptional repressor) of toxin-antitoxin stability system
MRNQVMSVTEFKAKCLALFDQIDQEGGTITVTKRGKPFVTVGPAKKKPFKSSEGALMGKGRIIGDIVNSDTSDLYDAGHYTNQLDWILTPKKKKGKVAISARHPRRRSLAS